MIARPVWAPPACTIRRANGRPRGQAQAAPGSVSSAPPPRSSCTAAGASRSAPHRLCRHSPRPAFRVSSAWRAGESSGASAAASPPWPSSWRSRPAAFARPAHRRALLGGAQRQVQAGRTAADHRDVRLAARSTRGYRTRQPMGLYLAHPSSLEHDTGSHRRTPHACGRSRRLDQAAWPALERVEAPAATLERRRVHSDELMTRSRRSARAAAA